MAESLTLLIYTIILETREENKCFLNEKRKRSYETIKTNKEDKMLENKLGIKTEAELAIAEEKLSKKKAI